MENLQLIIDQFLPGDYKIIEASDWFELHEGKHCTYSSPSELEFYEEVLAMVADQIKAAKQF